MSMLGKKKGPLDKVRSIEDLSSHPLEYERAALMEHIRRYDREELRRYYLRQPVEGAEVWANYVVNLWEYEHGVEQLTSYPWNITIPITEVCNAKCTFCSSPLVPAPQMTVADEIRHFSTALRYAIRVSLQGLGEPLAHPQFEAIVQEIQRYLNPVARLEIITNGWLLAGHRWELLKSIHISDIQVSVNAATDQTHQLAMGSRPGTFDQVVKNIENVLADSKWPRILKVSMVITRHSLPEVPQFLDLFAKKGVGKFQFNALLPLTTADWGFGHTEQYLDLWCGHLPGARALVEKAKQAIAKHRAEGITITATPEQWLLPVDQWRRANLVQLSVEQKETAVFQQPDTFTSRHPLDELGPLHVSLNGRALPLVPHQKHAEAFNNDSAGILFCSTPESCRWAYLLGTPSFRLEPGRYSLELNVDIHAGKLYGGILDVQKNDFVIQEPLLSGGNRFDFALSEQAIAQVIIRQADEDMAVKAVYKAGQLSPNGETAVATERRPDRAHPEERFAESASKTLSQALQPSGTPLAKTAEIQSGPASKSVPSIREVAAQAPAVQPVDASKAHRVYCPMVYTTLSVFHHSLDVSVCCYMENAPGHKRPNLKKVPLLEAYNDAGFQLVRRTLTTDQHIPVCDTCPYGNFRS